MYLMTNAKFLLLIFSLFLSGIILPISYAQAPAVITSFTVLDPNGNDVTDEFLVAGGSYTINFEIEIVRLSQKLNALSPISVTESSIFIFVRL